MARTSRKSLKEGQGEANSQSTNKRRNILLCVAGYTPQIITETLWALTQEQNLPIDEIRVITTLDGRDIIQSKLWANGEGKFYEFIRDYPACAHIRFDERCLSLLTRHINKMPSEFDLEEDCLRDVLTSRDNECAANQICEIVRCLTLENTRIHATVAGGRKSMSIYLTVAMQLFGRWDDTLSHVLVRKDLESRDFFYPEPQAKKRRGIKDQGVNLAFLPYIRLRGLGQEPLREGGLGYSRYVEEVQNKLNLAESDENLVLQLKKMTVRVGETEAKLPQSRILLYLLFALQRQQGGGQNGFLTFEEINKEMFDAAFRLLTKAKVVECGLDEFDRLLKAQLDGKASATGENPVRNYGLRSVFKSIQGWLKFKTGASANNTEDYWSRLREMRSRINSDLRKAGIPEKFSIKNPHRYGEARYGININPEKIIIEIE